MTDDDLLGMEDVATWLDGMPLATLRDWRARNVGPRSFRLRQRVVYKRSDVQEWLDAQMASTARGGAE